MAVDGSVLSVGEETIWPGTARNVDFETDPDRLVELPAERRRRHVRGLVGGRGPARDSSMGRLSATPHDHRVPTKIVSHAVWLYQAFGPGVGNVEPLPAERGVIMFQEHMRCRCPKFGQALADRPRRRRPKPADTWHLDEVFLRIGSTMSSIISGARGRPAWRRARILVEGRGGATAATRFLSARGIIDAHFRPRRPLSAAPDCARSRGEAFRIRQQETCAWFTERPTRRLPQLITTPVE